MMSPRKLRIVYTNHTGKVSGAERVLLNMLRGLDRTRYEPFVLCPAEKTLQLMLGREGVPYATMPTLQARFTKHPGKLFRYILSFLKTMIATRRQIALCDPDFIHANTVRAGIAATVATFGNTTPVIWHVHDTLPRHPLSSLIRLLSFTSRRTRIIAVSDATSKAFRGHLPFKNRACVIHNGTDLSRFPMKGRGESQLKRELGLSEQSFLICAVGQICARKGLLELLEAFSQIYDETPDIHLAIVGKPVFAHEETYLKKLVDFACATAISDRVHFTGERSDISTILQSADLLVLNSSDEPFGLVLVEAMSSGTPVLATRVGGIPEIVTDQESGWLIDKDNITALSSKIFELSRAPDQLAHGAQVAHDRVCPQFSLERFLTDLHAFYARLTKLPCAEQKLHAPALLAELHDKQGD